MAILEKQPPTWYNESMSIFASLGIIVLAIAIQGFLQLSPNLFAIFYHHALGKTSPKKADDRSLSFILGVELFAALAFLLVYFITSFFITEESFSSNIFIWAMTGIFVAEAIFFFFCYYKLGKNNKKTTKLFISRHLAESLVYRAEHAKNRSSTILLGVTTSAIEILFTLPLLIISSVEILRFDSRFGFLFIIVYVIGATAPLFAVRILYRTGHNLAEILRIRVKRKTFFRIVVPLCYLGLAALTLLGGTIR